VKTIFSKLKKLNKSFNNDDEDINLDDIVSSDSFSDLDKESINSFKDILDSLIDSVSSDSESSNPSSYAKVISSNLLSSLEKNVSLSKNTSLSTITLADSDSYDSNDPHSYYSADIQFIDNHFFISLFKEDISEIDYEKVPYIESKKIHYASIKIESQDLFYALHYLCESL